MASSTEDVGVKELVQREVDTEIKLMNDFLTELDYRKHYMSHFVSGLQVAVRSILSAAHAVKRRHPQESKKMIQVEKEETTTQPCPKVEEEEVSKVEEEQKEDTLTEDAAEDGSPSSELMTSLNNTLGDLEEAEEKLIEIDSRDHMSITDQSTGASCYLEFMYEFIADLRQKLQQSCEEFMSMESQTLALLEERKALQDLHFQLTNSPKKTAKPAETKPTLPQEDEGKDIAPTDTSAALSNTSPGTTKSMQHTEEKDTPSKLAPLPKDVSTSSTMKGSPHDKIQLTPHIVDENDYISPIGMRKLFDQYSPEAVNTSPDTKKIVTQTNDRDTPLDITPKPKDVSTSSTAEGNIDAKNQTQQIDDEFDYVSPLGMRRMFGSFSQEPKIFASPNSPSSDTNINLTQTTDKDTPSDIAPPPEDVSKSSTAAGNLDAKTQTQQFIDDEFDYVSPLGMRRMFGSLSQEPKIFVSPNSPSPDTKLNPTQTNDIDTPSDTAPPLKDVSTSSTAAGNLDAKNQIQEIVDDEFDYVSPLGMRRMFGSFSQEPKIFVSPNSPSPDTKTNLTPTNDKDTPSNLPTPPKDASASSVAEESPDSTKQSPEQIVDDEYDFSPFPLKKLFGSGSQESNMFLSPPSQSSVGISSVVPKLTLEVSPGSVDNES